jgi:hypothetical protein
MFHVLLHVKYFAALFLFGDSLIQSVSLHKLLLLIAFDGQRGTSYIFIAEHTPFHHVIIGKSRSRDGSSGIVTQYGLAGRVSVSGGGKIFFFIPQRRDRVWGPTIQWVSGALSVGVKWSGHGAKTPHIHGVSNQEWRRYISIPLYVSMVWCFFN